MMAISVNTGEWYSLRRSIDNRERVAILTVEVADLPGMTFH